MEWHEMLTSGYEGVLRTLQYTLDGLTEEDLNWQPKPDCNSIGWLAWHLTRVQDDHIASLMGEEQLGVKAEDLAKYTSPDAETLLGYQKAVLERSKRYFVTLSPQDLDIVFEGTPFKPPPTRGMMLMGTLSDSLQHAGQAAYVRGLREGMGWH